MLPCISTCAIMSKYLQHKDSEKTLYSAFLPFCLKVMYYLISNFRRFILWETGFCFFLFIYKHFTFRKFTYCNENSIHFSPLTLWYRLTCFFMQCIEINFWQNWQLIFGLCDSMCSFNTETGFLQIEHLVFLFR